MVADKESISEQIDLRFHPMMLVFSARFSSIWASISLKEEMGLISFKCCCCCRWGLLSNSGWAVWNREEELVKLIDWGRERERESHHTLTHTHTQRERESIRQVQTLICWLWRRGQSWLLLCYTEWQLPDSTHLKVCPPCLCINKPSHPPIKQ